MAGWPFSAGQGKDQQVFLLGGKKTPHRFDSTDAATSASWVFPLIGFFKMVAMLQDNTSTDQACSLLHIFPSFQFLQVEESLCSLEGRGLTKPNAKKKKERKTKPPLRMDDFFLSVSNLASTLISSGEKKNLKIKFYAKASYNKWQKHSVSGSLLALWSQNIHGEESKMQTGKHFQWIFKIKTLLMFRMQKLQKNTPLLQGNFVILKQNAIYLWKL